MQNISIWTSRQTSVPIDIVRTIGLGNIRGRTISGNLSGNLLRSFTVAGRYRQTPPHRYGSIHRTATEA